MSKMVVQEMRCGSCGSTNIVKVAIYTYFLDGFQGHSPRKITIEVTRMTDGLYVAKCPEIPGSGVHHGETSLDTAESFYSYVSKNYGSKS